MESVSPMDSWWVLFTLPAILGFSNSFDPILLCISIVLAIFFLALLTWAVTPGGRAWRHGRTRMGKTPIAGPKGLPVVGSLYRLSRGLAHRTLASMASTFGAGAGATKLMAFSLGSTPVVVSSDPQTAKEILSSPHFADRPIKQSARLLLFSRAIGFAPNGTYWRLLRRIASSHLFAPKRIAAHEAGRQLDCSAMLLAILDDQTKRGAVVLRDHLQAAALNNIMGSVFGKRYQVGGQESQELKDLREMVKEGFDLLGAFNWSDYLPWLSFFYDPFRIKQRCAALVPRVRKFVRGIIQEHRLSRSDHRVSDNADFVDVLLSLEGEEKLAEDDMIAVLWEMIFRGTDTTALLTEWVMAELVLNQEVQAKLRRELEMVVGVNKSVRDADVANLPYLQAVIKETLRIHPPGPLLSWARLSTSDVQLSNGMVVPAQTTAMVNMWSITHDPSIWKDPLMFRPERFIEKDIDIKGTDLRLAPFGAGRRVCPGKNLGMVTVSLWVAKLIQNFNWISQPENPVDLSEVLKLSCEMEHKLTAVVAIPARDDDVLCPSFFM